MTNTHTRLIEKINELIRRGVNTLINKKDGTHVLIDGETLKISDESITGKDLQENEVIIPFNEISEMPKAIC